MTSEFMRVAIEEAARALGRTSPNPAVGAVVVRDGHVIGRGHTQPPGSAHAEVVAIRDAGDARGASMYVTLEPHGFHGRTPPCTDAIIEAGISAVHYAIPDPNPQVNGDGDRQLRAAGIAVTAGDGAEEVRRQLEGYLHHRRTGDAFVVAKYAASLDGRIAAASGDARWVSGPEAREWAHRLRAQVDAVLVGVGTVLADDPELTSRPGGAPHDRQPLRVVVDSRARTPPSATVLRDAAAVPTVIATTERAGPQHVRTLERAGAEVLVLPQVRERVDLGALMRALGGRGVLTALAEGGGTLLGALFDGRHVGRLYAVIAPVVIGARSAPAAVSGTGAERMADAPRLTGIQVERLGDDVLISGVPAWPDGER